MKAPAVNINHSYKFPPPPKWYDADLNFKRRCIKTQKPRLIYVIDYGKSSYSEITSISHARYAAKIGADLMVKRVIPTGDYPMVWEKFRIHEHLKAGQTVLLLDNDTIVTPACPDLFYMCQDPYIYAADQKAIHNDPQSDVETGIQSACYKMGLEYKEGPSINAGVMLVAPECESYFEWPQLEHLSELVLFEQDYLTALIRQDVSVWRPLPIEANMWNVAPGVVPWIVHAAGRVTADKYGYLAQFA